MTFCLGIKLADGLVGIADTRVLSGNEMVVARKVSVYQEERGAMFLMTAGLRSLRDKAVTYFEESLAQQQEPLDHLFKAVNLFAAQIRRVAQEDRESLQASGLLFDASGYGKPILDRTLKYQDPMRFALKVGCLAFDSTRVSAAGVDFPIDVVLYKSGSYRIIEHRYEKKDLEHASNWWQERLRASVNELPDEWIEPAFAGLKD